MSLVLPARPLCSVCAMGVRGCVFLSLMCRDPFCWLVLEGGSLGTGAESCCQRGILVAILSWVFDHVAGVFFLFALF